MGKAVKKVFKELELLSPEKFQEEVSKYRDDERTSSLVRAWRAPEFFSEKKIKIYIVVCFFL